MALSPPPIPQLGEHLWLRDSAALDAWLDELAPGTPVAIDSEFERTNTFFAIPGLLQVATRASARLIEPEAAAGSARFRQWLNDSTQPKWLYAMSEDIELFREWLGCAVEGVLDIQIAAALAGEGMSVGYARLVEAVFGVSLGKEETRSDWLRRPLSEAQQVYALADVIYLIPMAESLLDRLDQLGRREALEEESRRFARDLQSQGTPEQYYLRLRGGWRLNHAQQEVLQVLAQWREQEAREQDTPRSRVIADKLLLQIAERLPTDMTELGQIRELPRGVVRKYGATLLELVEQGRALSVRLPEYIEGPLTRNEQAVYGDVKAIVHACCDSAGIPPELFAPRKKLEVAVREGVRGACLPELLATGWRGGVLAERREALQNLFSSQGH